MKDTISATAGWAPADTSPTFLTPDDLEPVDVPGIDRVSGGGQDMAALPALVVEFTTLTPDFQGLAAFTVPPPDQSDMLGQPVSLPGGASSVIVAFDPQPTIIPGDGQG